MNLSLNKHRKFFKIFLFVCLLFVLFFWDAALRISGKDGIIYLHREVLSIPISQRLNNEMFNREEFLPLQNRISKVLEKYEIRGASVAVMKEGKLVYAKGFGYADHETGRLVEPKSIFRIASISKLITSVAVMKLVEDGKLSLDDKVFGDSGILNDSIYLNFRDKRVGSITVRHLLNHSAGWNRNFGDHMFMQHEIARQMNVELPVGLPVIIKFALSKRLHFNPGSGASYSNLGYAILSLIIERVSGQQYVDFVTDEIFRPNGIHDIYMGGNMREDKRPNEVYYYEQSNAELVPSVFQKDNLTERVYGGNDIKLLGAAGGWIATAPEMMKFLALIDGDKNIPDILSPETIQLMTNPYNSEKIIGWSGTNDNGTWWRTGAFAGTSAILMRQEDGFSWVIITNTSTWRGTGMSNIFRREMNLSLNEIEIWPEYNLFQKQDLEMLKRSISLKNGNVLENEVSLLRSN